MGGFFCIYGETARPQSAGQVSPDSLSEQRPSPHSGVTQVTAVQTPQSAEQFAHDSEREQRPSPHRLIVLNGPAFQT